MFLHKYYNLSFITIIENFEQFKETCYKNVKKYANHDDVEFVFFSFFENINIREYITTNLFYELKTEKVKYYTCISSENYSNTNFNLIANNYANGEYIYYIKNDQLLHGNEYKNLKESDKKIITKAENIFKLEKLDIENFKIVTCFSVLYKCDKFIDNLIQDITSQTIFNNIQFILINMHETNNEETNKKIETLKKYSNINVINEITDYGLYNMWNTCIQMSETFLVSNMNPDDIRGPNWAYEQIIHFEPNVILVTPKYIPTPKIVTHEELINDIELPVWFQDKCDIQNDEPIFTKIDSYFQSKDMFQYNDNFTFQTYNIPNCSPIWRKNSIHKNNNYFNEKNGVYADYAVWLEAGSKNELFKQTDYKVGFYISDNQLHKNQKNDIYIFYDLINKYANENYLKTLQNFLMTSPSYYQNNLNNKQI